MSYNIHNSLTDADRDALLDHLKRLNPGLVIVMDNPGYAVRLKRALPNTRVVYRKYFPSDNGGDDHAHTKVTPQQWLNVYVSEIPPSEGVFYYAGNEPGWNADLIQWLTEVARLVLQANAKACLGNWSVGTPGETAWLQAKDLLRLCGDNPARLMIGVHEYAPTFVGREFGLQYDPAKWPDSIPGASWLLGRYRHLLKACDTLGVRRPKIAITEWGFDRIHAVGDWQQSLPRTPGQELIGPLWGNLSAWDQMKPASMGWPTYMLRQLEWAWKAIYSRDPAIVGTALFCWGADPGSAWAAFDYKRVSGIMSLMESVKWTMNAQPTGDRWIVRVRIREAPSLKAAIKGEIAIGTPASVLSTTSADGYLWTAVPGGYAAYVNLKTRVSYVGE